MIQRTATRRAAPMPDPVKLARFLRAPELGPRVLFLTGGTALKALSRRIIDYTHNSIHLVTPFDSGGSSAKLRKAFDMPAVGDLRNRLMALADHTIPGVPEVYALFAHRLPGNAAQEELRQELARMVDGHADLVRRVPEPIRTTVCTHLRHFAQHMPEDFDLRDASIGNLILTGGYLNCGRRLESAITLFSKLVAARGQVRPVTYRPLHLAAELADDATLVGQHLITGKEVPAIASPVRRVYLTERVDAPRPCQVDIQAQTASLIGGADLICYPMGSFYTSLVANLLPCGVGRAIAGNPCPKVYIPNLGRDPEQLGMTLLDQVRALFAHLERDCPDVPPRSLLDFVLLDARQTDYGPSAYFEEIRRLGLEVVDAPLVSQGSSPYLDEERVIEYLLSLV